MASTDGIFNFRQAAPATVGALMLLGAVALVVFVGRRTGRPILPDWGGSNLEFFIARCLLYFSALVTLSCGFFQFFGYQWLVGYQTAFFNLLGFYAAWTLEEEYLLMYSVLGLFNWFSVVGQLPLLGYTASLVEQDVASCQRYFVGSLPPSADLAGRCEGVGYLNYLRLLGLLTIFFQAIGIFIAFRIYRNPDLDEIKKAAVPILSSSYESISDAARRPQPELVIPPVGAGLGYQAGGDVKYGDQ